MARAYNDPVGGTASTAGSQIRTDQYIKKALIEARKEQYFGQLADVTSMPKNMGKKIKKYHYLPLLDVLNVNDQGIDAAGATILSTQFYISYTGLVMEVANGSKAAAVTAIENNVGATITCTAGANDSGVSGTGFASLTLVGGTYAKYADATKKNAVVAFNLGVSVTQGGGNLYGSSKDIGSITGKLPALSENGGRVNRVGFKRVEVEGSINKFGFFDEYTQESVDFDSDSELQTHINREMINGAMEMTEDALQIDLLQSAGVVKYAGVATSPATIVGVNTTVTYGDLLRLSVDLDNNRAPKKTKVLTGTRMVDTKTVAGGRVLYCGSELLPTLEAMTDLHSAPAFVAVQHYAGGTTVMNGEVGSVGNFRIVIVPEMVKWAGAGGDLSSTAGETAYYETNEQCDVFPMLVVCDGAFTTIGFQTDGKTVKFKITHKAPGTATADKDDPYGETGFMSIKWYYGFLLQRPERIGLIKTAALV